MGNELLHREHDEVPVHRFSNSNNNSLLGGSEGSRGIDFELSDGKTISFGIGPPPGLEDMSPKTFNTREEFLMNEPVGPTGLGVFHQDAEHIIPTNGNLFMNDHEEFSK